MEVSYTCSRNRGDGDSNDHATMNRVDGGLLFLQQVGWGRESNEKATMKRVDGCLLYLKQEARGYGTQMIMQQ